MLPSFSHQDVEIIHATLVEDHGSELATYDLNDTSKIEWVYDCVIEPTEGEEDDNGERWDYDLNAPPETNLHAHDLVRYRGMLLEVIAPPQEFESPTGLRDYQASKLRTWTHGN